MVPVDGLEPPTYRLQGGCSTTELNRKVLLALLQGVDVFKIAPIEATLPLLALH